MKRTWVFWLLAGVLGIVGSFILGWIPAYMWMKSFHYAAIWESRLIAKFAVGSSAAIIIWALFYANWRITMWISQASSTQIGVRYPRQLAFLKPILERWIENSRKNPWPFRIFCALVVTGISILSVLFGMSLSAQWSTLLLGLNAVHFGIADPIFGHDLAFYVLQLPAIQIIQQTAWVVVGIAMVFSVWVYITRGGILLLFGGRSDSRYIRVHLMGLLAALTGIIAVGFWLSNFELVTVARNVTGGPGYTDVHIRIGLNWIVVGLLGLQSLFFAVSAFWGRIEFPILSAGGIFVLSTVMTAIIPTVVQNYVVSPDEFNREKDFIKHSISYTQKGWGLDKIQYREFPANNTLSAEAIQKNATTIKNIRLWDPKPLKQTFGQLQEIRLYYDFSEIDIDRYIINGELQQVMLSPRELAIDQLNGQAQTWVNRHLVYTHGYGICMSPVNAVTEEGLPEFYIKNIPPESSVKTLKITNPAIYFGEKQRDYILVNSGQKEFDYPKGDTNVYTQYTGLGGIQLNSWWKRAIFASYFSDIKIFISQLITPKTRIIYQHSIPEIIKTITPFLAIDSDPYIVLRDNGTLAWIIDAYTISDRYPYSERHRSGINYIRNSVKITVDAYSGTVKFYISDPTDPIIATWAKIFPTLFQPISRMPADLHRHIRYPEMMMALQADMLGVYHMSNPQVFYNREDVWNIPVDTMKQKPMNPYYLVTKIPGQATESLVLMMPFTPSNKSNMVAWMAANCDRENYGKLTVFQFPKDKTVYGPAQIESRIDQDTEISQQLTLWGQVGSGVIRGNMMVIPIDQSIIYVEPIYLQATQGKLPEFKRVILAYRDKIDMAPDLPSAIGSVFGAQKSVIKSPQAGSSTPQRPALNQIRSAFMAMKRDIETKMNAMERLFQSMTPPSGKE